MNDIDKNEDVAEDWYRNQIGWFMYGGSPEFPHRGQAVTNHYEDGSMSRRFRGGYDHEEGGVGIEIVIRRRDDGVWELEKNTHSVDCDGPLDRYWSAMVIDGEIVDEEASQRDHFAEAMGY